MNLLFAIDDTFVEQLKTTLYSIWLHTSASRLDAFVLQEKELAQTEKLNQFCHGLGIVYHPVIIGTGSIFKQAPVSDRYPESIYYRLLAQNYLPKDLDKVYI